MLMRWGRAIPVSPPKIDVCALAEPSCVYYKSIFLGPCPPLPVHPSIISTMFNTIAATDLLIYTLVIFLLFNASKLFYGYLFHRSNFIHIPGPPSQSWFTGKQSMSIAFKGTGTNPLAISRQFGPAFHRKRPTISPGTC